LGLAIDDGWCYATNNHIFVGTLFPASAGIHALLPSWVVDFLIGHAEGLTQWAFAENFMAFRWDNGAWMRSTLIDDRFPERAGQMIREAPVGSQPISEDYRQTMIKIVELSDIKVTIYADRVEGSTARTKVSEQIANPVPENSPFSIWGTEHLGPMMAVANTWSPAVWPAPAPFTSDRIRGYILGRSG
jgi:hypothetical protein